MPAWLLASGYTYVKWSQSVTNLKKLIIVGYHHIWTGPTVVHTSTIPWPMRITKMSTTLGICWLQPSRSQLSSQSTSQTIFVYNLNNFYMYMLRSSRFLNITTEPNTLFIRILCYSYKETRRNRFSNVAARTYILSKRFPTRG